MRTRKTVDYLDAAKLKLGLTSDRALATHLGVTQQAVSWYRAKGGTFEAMTATKIAEILEINPMRVIADAELERARSPAARAFWGAVLGKVAAIVLGVFGLAAIATPNAEAAGGGRFDISISRDAPARPEAGRNMHCRRILRRALAWLRGWL